MRTVLIAYATHEGHTRDIAERVAFTLGHQGIEVIVHDISTGDIDLTPFERVVLASSVQLGRHPRSMVKFARDHRDALVMKDAVFVQVCGAIAAAEHAEDPLRCEEYARDAELSLDRFCAASGWTPRHLELVAGAFLYREYNWLVRLIMKSIARREGLSTDTTENHDYTDWAAVDRFASGLSSEAPPSPS